MGVFLAQGEYGRVEMVGYDSVDDDDDVFLSGSDHHDLDHGVIVIIVPAQDGLLHPFQTDVNGLQPFQPSVRKRADCNPFHGANS